MTAEFHSIAGFPSGTELHSKHCRRDGNVADFILNTVAQTAMWLLSKHCRPDGKVACDLQHLFEHFIAVDMLRHFPCSECSAHHASQFTPWSGEIYYRDRPEAYESRSSLAASHKSAARPPAHTWFLRRTWIYLLRKAFMAKILGPHFWDLGSGANFITIIIAVVFSTAPIVMKCFRTAGLGNALCTPYTVVLSY